MARLWLAVGLCAILGAQSLAADEVTVFAAASLQDVLADAGAVLEAEHGITLRVNAAGSSLMARQVAAGAPADLVILANADWMGWLSEQGVLRDETRVDVARNTLVVIGPAHATEMTAPADPAQALGGQGRIAVALLEEVPAGLYASEALTALGLLEALRPRLLEAQNVRTALAFVASGAAERGIVYASDAQADLRVKPLASFEASSHEPIRHPAALTPRAGPAARAALAMLAGPEGEALFCAHGFLPPVGACPP